MKKKNLLKIPKPILTQLKQLSGKPVIAACSRVYSAEELVAGRLKHLGVQVIGDTLSFPQSIVPPWRSGKYSSRNVNGEEVIRKDLPMKIHYHPVESPNWGDSYKGTHTSYLPYRKYPRDFIGPRLRRINISSAKASPGQSSYVLVFEVDQVLDQGSREFKDDLLECLNLLQENVGLCGVQKSGATLADYLQTLTVSWEVLPPGTKEEAITRLFGGRQPSPKERQEVEERYDFLMSLQPQKLVYGTSGLQRYFGGLIREGLVVFENIEYGNAMYIMFENWKDLSHRTRTELLSGRYGTNFERVTHTSGWKGTVRKIIKNHPEDAKGPSKPGRK